MDKDIAGQRRYTMARPNPPHLIQSPCDPGIRDEPRRPSPALAITLVLTLAAMLLPRQGQAQQGASEAPAPRSLVERLRDAVEGAALGERVGISVINLRSGREVFSHHAQLPLNPASNMKLVTAAAALLELGPAHEIRTALYGRQQGDAIQGGLYVRGFGDPTLTSGDLISLAQELVRRGVRKVDEVLIDSTFFDQSVLPPAFEQQPNEVSPFRAAVSAVSVNRNAFDLRIAPGAAAGEPVKVRVDAPGYFDLDNQATTSAGGPPRIIAIQKAKGDKQVLKLRGTVPIGITGVRYRRRIESPDHYAGHIMVEALKALRVQVPRRVGTGPTPGNRVLLAERRSPPLGQMLVALGKNSDNFVAEMTLKLLGAEKAGAPGTSASGVRIALEALRTLGVPATKITMVNGSGLFTGNEIASSHITALLGGMYQRTDLRADYLAHLAIGGVDGTLRQRMKHLPAQGIVRAKTGTLNGVIALSGYVLGPSPERGFAFSFLANGVEGKHHAARSLADSLVTTLANYLYAR